MRPGTGARTPAPASVAPPRGHEQGAPAPTAGAHGAPSGLLGNPGVSAAVDVSRRRRWVLRERARGLQPSKGAGCCGRYSLTGQLSLARRGERWAPSGLLHCAMVWLCPVCSARVGQRRAEEVADAVRRWQASGGTVLLVTWTLAHQADDSLDGLLRVFTDARSRMRSRRSWARLRERVGWQGEVRNWEVSWGDWHGWHPHQHALVFCRLPKAMTGGLEFVSWWRDLEQLWASCVASVSPQHTPGDGERLGVGVRVDVVGQGEVEDAAGYLTKDMVHGAAMEVARPDAKAGRAGRATPWELQERAVDGHARERGLWQEYAAATRDRHRVRWSPGLRERLGVRVRSDEQLAHDEGDADEVEDLDDDETALLMWAPEVTPAVCEAAELGGPAAAHHLLAHLLSLLTGVQRAELRRWARPRVDLAGRWARPRRQDRGRAPPGEDSPWARASEVAGTRRPVSAEQRRALRARAAAPTTVAGHGLVTDL